MNHKIIPLVFPYNTVRAVASQNRDSTYTIYTNTLCPDATQEAAARELIGQLNEEGAEV